MKLEDGVSIREMLRKDDEERARRVEKMVLDRYSTTILQALCDRFVQTDILDDVLAKIHENPYFAEDFSENQIVDALRKVAKDLQDFLGDALLDVAEKGRDCSTLKEEEEALLDTVDESGQQVNTTIPEKLQRYTINRNGVTAFGTYDSVTNEMVIHKGSLMVRDFSGNDSTQCETSLFIVESKWVEPNEDHPELLRLKRDLRCKSPALAASMVKGSNSGRRSWKSESGSPLGEGRPTIRKSSKFSNGLCVEFVEKSIQKLSPKLGDVSVRAMMGESVSLLPNFASPLAIGKRRSALEWNPHQNFKR